MRRLIRLIIAIAVMGVMFTFWGAKDVKILSQEPIDLATADWNTLKAGDYIKTEVKMVWGCVFSEVDEDGRETGRGYAVPYIGPDATGTQRVLKLIGLKTYNSSEFGTLEQILDDTYDRAYNSPETIGQGPTTYYVEGVLLEMSDRELNAMRDFAYGCNFSVEEANQVICPYMIVNRSFQGAKTMLTIGIVIDIIFVALIAFVVIKSKKEKETYNSGYMGMSSGMYGGANYGASNRYGGENTYGGTNNKYTSGGYGVQGEELDFENWNMK